FTPYRRGFAGNTGWWLYVMRDAFRRRIVERGDLISCKGSDMDGMDSNIASPPGVLAGLDVLADLDALAYLDVLADLDALADLDVLAALGQDGRAFALLSRPGSAQNANVEVLAGEVCGVDSLAELPLPGEPASGAQHDLLVAVPYRQI